MTWLSLSFKVARVSAIRFMFQGGARIYLWFDVSGWRTHLPFILIFIGVLIVLCLLLKRLVEEVLHLQKHEHAP